MIMVDIDLAKKHKEKTGAKKFWNSRTFSELFAYSPVEAAQYQLDCRIADAEIFGMPSAEYIKQQEALNNPKPVEIKEEPKKEVVEVVEKEESTDLTKEDVQELLKANKIDFHHALGIKKLVELAITNKLL